MGIQKYVFNHKTLSYEKFKLPTGKRIFHAVLYLLTTCVFAIAFLILFYSFFESPKEKMQARELEYMKLQYEILNDRIEDMNVVLADVQKRDDNIYRVIFEADPIPVSVRKAGFGGVDRYENLYGYKNSEIVVDIAKRLDQVASQLYVQSKSYDEVFEMALNKAEMLSSIPAIQPVKDADIKRISSYYGYRTDPFYKVSKFHNGIDYSAPIGTEIYATGDGKVVNVEKSKWGYGNLLTIDHGFGYKTQYAHLQKFEVKKGQNVKRGQLIGYVGNTGKSTAPHLHYEVLKNGKALNPVHFFYNDLTPEEYELILELSALPSQTMD
jgi:Membrane proteins related to metalloendopeptidases